jgi:hypothetical protein
VKNMVSRALTICAAALILTISWAAPLSAQESSADGPIHERLAEEAGDGLIEGVHRLAAQDEPVVVEETPRCEESAAAATIVTDTEPTTIRWRRAAEPVAIAPSTPDRPRLRWRRDDAAVSLTTPRGGEEAVVRNAVARPPSRARRLFTRISERSWRARLLYQYSLLAGRSPEVTQSAMQVGLGVEIASNHVITIQYITGFSGAFGIVAGYAFELEVVPRVVRIELRGTIGYTRWEQDSWNISAPKQEVGYCIFGLQPTLHVGYRWIYFSLNPHMTVIPSIAGGISVGFTLRI